MPALWIAFALSGAAALLAEQVFEKLLSTLVGATTPASAVVLAIYFAGLTAGALAYPKVRRARWSPLVMYAVLEIAVAAACAGLAWKYDALVPAFAPVLRLGVGSPALLTFLRGVVSAAWILPLTVPMGATFPAIVDATDRLAHRTPEAKTRSVNVLYAMNLVGAIVASFAGPFVVFPNLGMTGGLLTACAFDATAAALALYVSRSRALSSEPAAPTNPDATRARVHVPWRLVAFAAFTGFLLFSLEVVWTHLAGAVLGNSVYAFASMLGSVLIGLGIGSLLSAVLFRRDARVPSWAPGAALVIGAVVLAAVHAMWVHAPSLLFLVGSSTHSFAGSEVSRFAIAALMFVPPTAVLGLAYPLLFRARDFPDVERGGAAGRIAGANAMGCIAGALVTGFVVLPALGSENTERALVVLTAIVGASFFLKKEEHTSARVRRGGVTTGLVAIAIVALVPRWNYVALTLGQNVYFTDDVSPFLLDLLSFHEDTRSGMTTVTHDGTMTPSPLVLRTNGKFQGNDGAEMPAQTAFALVPTQFLQHFDRALVIGLGTGRSAHVVQSMGFGAVDIAEISPGIVAAARDFFPHVNGRVLEAPNVSLMLEDGRNALLLREQTYDLVTIELTSVWFAGATNLYSREFYALVRDRLREGGVLQEWIQLHHIGVRELESVLATVHGSFPYVAMYYVGSQGLVVASGHPLTVTPEFAAQLRAKGAWRLMESHDADEATAQLAWAQILTSADVDRVVARPGVILTTDGNRYLEYATPRYNFKGRDLRRGNIAALRWKDSRN